MVRRAVSISAGAALAAFLTAIDGAASAQTLSVGVKNERHEPLCVATAQPRYDVVRLGPPLDAAVAEIRTLSSGVAEEGKALQAFGDRIKELGLQTCSSGFFGRCRSAPQALGLGDDLKLLADLLVQSTQRIATAVDTIAQGAPFPATPETRGGPDVHHEAFSQNWDTGAVGFVTVKGFDCVSPSGYREIEGDLSLAGSHYQLGVHVPPAGAMQASGPRPLTRATMNLAGGPHLGVNVAGLGDQVSIRQPAAREPDRSATIPVSAASAGRSLTLDELLTSTPQDPARSAEELRGEAQCNATFWACVPSRLGSEGYDSVVLRFAGTDGLAAGRAETTCQTLYGTGVTAAEFLACEWPLQSEPATIIVRD